MNLLAQIIGSAIALWLAAYLTGIGPSLRRVSLAIKNLTSRKRRDETCFRFVLCWFEQDRNGQNTAFVLDVLREVPGITLERSARIVRATGGKDARERTVEIKARAVLRRWRGDLAVVGRVRKAEEKMSVWFIPNVGSGTLDPGYRSYHVKDFEPVGSFHEDLRIQLQATALTAAAKAQGAEDKRAVVDRGLRGVRRKLSALLDRQTMKEVEHRVALRRTLGDTLLALGQLRGARKHLGRAVAAHRAAIEGYIELKRTSIHMAPAPLGRLEQGFGVVIRDPEDGPDKPSPENDEYRSALKETARLLDKPSRIEWAEMLRDLGIALMKLGEHEVGTQHLEEAVLVFAAARDLFAEADRPVDLALTLASLGHALSFLSEIEGGTAKLAEALRAFRVAMGAFEREDRPADLVRTRIRERDAALLHSTRHNDLEAIEVTISEGKRELAQEWGEDTWLWRSATWITVGDAHRKLAERETGAGNLDAAAKAYRRALTETPRGAMAVGWSRAQSSLGQVLLEMGERTGQREHIEEARIALDAALEEHTPNRQPRDWGTTQLSLGRTLSWLGERDRDFKTLRRSRGAFRTFQEVFTRKKAPYEWATAQNNIGASFLALGKIENQPQRKTIVLERAESVLRAALEGDAHLRSRSPLSTARIGFNLGNALLHLGWWEDSTQRLEQAAESYEMVIGEIRRENDAVLWARAHLNLGAARLLLGRLTKNKGHLDGAVKAIRTTSGMCTAWPDGWITYHLFLGSALETLGTLESDTETLKDAEEAYSALCERSVHQNDPTTWASAKQGLGRTLLTLDRLEGTNARAEDAREAIEAGHRESARLAERARHNRALDTLDTEGNELD